MNMSTDRLALRLVAFGSVLGTPEELVGDLIEEIAQGRSRTWVCRQVIALYAYILVGRLRSLAAPTPRGIALAMCLVLIAGVSIAPPRVVLVAWLGFYYVAGTLSLFAHMASRSCPTIDNR
jgi:hypothetical protein